MLGQPDRIRTDFEDTNTTWTYFAPELQLEHSIDDQAGELDVHFSRMRWFSNRTAGGWPAINNPEDSLGSYRITGGSLRGWPRHVLRAMDFVRRTMVANPDMQWRGGSLPIDYRPLLLRGAVHAAAVVVDTQRP